MVLEVREAFEVAFLWHACLLDGRDCLLAGPKTLLACRSG
jgi:hypothetical protein